ncbi:gluconokinase [Rhodococcus sp. 077-4]|uniref:gluconokinase n=1 Tax=Rhodococcus sp. 077-4 TaxID=2789271 RepID=UPI0039F4F8E0
MGVSGCGKSTVSQLLSVELGAAFSDADDHHPEVNIDKMRRGIALDDADRAPWLHTLGTWVAHHDRLGSRTVLACSALRRSYREQLRSAVPTVVFVHLSGTRDAISARLRARTGHFMPPELLDSQLSSLEPLGPDEAGVTIDIDHTPTELVHRILDALALPRKVSP